MLLKNAKCGCFVTKYDSCYKMQRLLRNVSVQGKTQECFTRCSINIEWSKFIVWSRRLRHGNVSNFTEYWKTKITTLGKSV